MTPRAHGACRRFGKKAPTRRGARTLRARTFIERCHERFANVPMLSITLTFVAVASGAVGCAVAACGIYLLVLSVAALCFSPPPRLAPSTRLMIVIPAHNESMLIARCVGSLRAQNYPNHRYEVVVVADNCTDDTAKVAAAAGAHRVLVRDDPDARGKGYALRWAMDQLLADAATDAIVVVDADSVADRDFLMTLVQPFEAGARAVQGESLMYGDGSPGSTLRVLAFLLVNRVRPTGRAVLRLSATHLAGNGMLLARDQLLTKPWNAFTSAEDLEYSLDLHLSGIRIAFARGAVLLSPTAPDAHAATQQQLRWEGGKMRLARAWMPKLLARAISRRQPALLGLAFDLAMPPLGFLSAIALAGAVTSAALSLAGLLREPSFLPWAVALTAITLHVFVGMRAANAPAPCYRALLGAPWFVVTKLMRLKRVLTFDADTWVRTDRKSATR